MIKKGYDMMHAYAVKIRCIHKKKKKKKKKKIRRRRRTRRKMCALACCLASIFINSRNDY
jgi:GH24 family phage-related lysozyme (muramidase)